MAVECMLCAEQAEFIGVGECNHEPICFRCIYKMRVISKNNQCPICKTPLKSIIIMEEFCTYNTFKNNVLQDKTFGDVFYSCEAAQKAFEKLNEFKCFVKIDGKPCKFDKKFPSVGHLKKHLKEDHNRYICEICVEKKTCVLEEQKLYTYKALNKHVERGDIDQFGNVTFLHPFCKFCNKSFFDEDEFRRHINLEHIICNVCGVQQKYRYYKNYDSLEVHYKISHYICSEEYCLGKKFIAFKNAEELRVHKLQVHDKNAFKKIDIKELCGFQYEGHNPDDEITIIKDKEGINMEDQFLNLKKCKNKALGEADQQIDSILDIRAFYETKLDEDEHFEQAFSLKQGGQQKKKKYVQKNDQVKDKPTTATANSNNQAFILQDLQLIKSMHMSKLSFQEFENRFKTILREEEINKFNSFRTKLNKKQIKSSQFVQQFLLIMKDVNLKGAYHIFPHYLRTIQNQDLKLDLDEEFVKKLKSIPTKHPNLISKSYKYSDFFGILLKEIEKNIESRIKSKELSLKKPVKRCKERLFQIMGVVRRLKIDEMVKFKFATNFGMQKQTLDYLQNHIFKKSFNQIQDRIDKIGIEQLLDLYIFVKFSAQAIRHSKNMQTQKGKIHENILEDFLFDRPQLEKQFGLKKEDMKNLDEQVEFEKIEEERKLKKQLKQMEKKGFQTKTDFNLVDKGDFPELVVQKKQSKKREQNFKDVIYEVKDKPATYQKKINEMFPTLGGGDPNESKPVEAQVQSKPKQDRAWWEKINEKKKQQWEEEEAETKIRKGKKGKNQKWVSVKGVFN